MVTPKSRRTHANITVYTIKASAAVSTRVRLTLVNFSLTPVATKSKCALTGHTISAINTTGAILTWVGRAPITSVCLTKSPGKTGCAVTPIPIYLINTGGAILATVSLAFVDIYLAVATSETNDTFAFVRAKMLFTRCTILARI